MIKLYRLTNGNKIIHILGTAHNIPLKYLPENIVQFISNHNSMVTESNDIMIHTIYTTRLFK